MVEQYMTKRHVVEYEVADLMEEGKVLVKDCNVIGFSGFCSITQLLNQQSKIQDIKLGARYFSKSPVSVVTRGDDLVFSDFVNMVINALLAAEGYGITQTTYSDFPQTDLFGSEYKDMFRNAIQFHGNFDELFRKTMPEFWPRSGFNRINDGSTGLLYTLPYGSIAVKRPPSIPLGPLLQAILDRGHLRCGVQIMRPGFAVKHDEDSANSDVISGMDADFCRAVAASLFQGDTLAVVFVELKSPTSGYQLLASGDLDILAGATWNLQNDVREPTTGIGFAFSQPYFYNYGTSQGNLCLATRQEDHDWSSFVNWIVTATFHAEAEGITQQTSNLMPEVGVYGVRFNRMLRDSILACGSYEEVYARNVERYVPRQGRNQLNSNMDPQPQHYILPGFFDGL